MSFPRISLKEILVLVTMAAIAIGMMAVVFEYQASKLVGVGLVFFAIAAYLYGKPSLKRLSSEELERERSYWRTRIETMRFSFLRNKVARYVREVEEELEFRKRKHGELP